jgi:hypothetical protein
MEEIYNINVNYNKDTLKKKETQKTAVIENHRHHHRWLVELILIEYLCNDVIGIVHS